MTRYWPVLLVFVLGYFVGAKFPATAARIGLA